jgi:tetratricopeptide (TPR) repeat protein
MDARLMRSRFAVFLRPFVGLALVGAFSGPVAAQPSPPGVSICDMPNMRGTAIYNRYCGGSARAPSPAPYIPPPPTPEQIAAQHAHELNEKGVTAFNAGDFAEAETFFSQAAEAAPDDAVIANNLANARDRLKTQRDSAARREAIVQHLDRLSSELSASTTAPAVPGLDFSGAPAAGGLRFMEPGAKSENPNLDTSVVDARNVPSGLPKFVDDAIASGYSGEPPGVSDRVRKGFQAVAAHDWNAARAWFEDALNHDPQNAGLKRLTELADFTLARTSRNKAVKAASTSGTLQLPESSDMQFLFSEEAQKPAHSGTALQLPKESDLAFLFPGLPALEAKELSDYTEKHWIDQIETDPQLIHAGSRSPRKPSVSHVTK